MGREREDRGQVNPLIEKLGRRDALSDEERAILERASARVVEFSADETMAREHDRPSHSTLILSGWAARYTILGDGRRQITAFHVPGDFVDLHSFLLKVMDHGIVALTPCKAALVAHDALQEITQEHPHLARLLWLNTLIDGAILRQWLIGAGKRRAGEHMAHLFCELFTRLQVVGQTKSNSFRIPITQAEFGDALGLSAVHTNRTLQMLRGEGLIEWNAGTIALPDWERISAFAEFDPTYLNLEHERR